MPKTSLAKIRFYIIGVLLIILIGAVSVIMCGCNTTEEKDTTTPYTITYSTTEGGNIKRGDNPNGNKLVVQIISHGENAEEVVAVPDKGYYFVAWSDGNTSAVRQDTEITKSLDLTAEFAEISDGVKVVYKADGEGFIYGEKEQIVQRGTDSWKVEAKLYDNSKQGVVFIGWSDGVTETVRQDKKVTADMEIVAKFGYTINYTAGDNGKIVGETNQVVMFGNHAETITALPDKGYRFVEWSDGVKTATRQDLWISEAINVYAKFEWRDTDSFTYNYNYATGNYFEDELTLTRGEVDGVTAVVPQREYFNFEGWYLDEGFNEKAIDSNGNNLLGEDIFNSPSRDLYAKWKVREEYVANYKILMVYVTAIDGNFEGNDGQNVEVHYRMSGKEKLQYLELSKQFRDTLNDMLDGLVIFDVDSYFTRITLDEQSFLNKKFDTCVYADNIPELNERGILNDYRSVLTVFSFGGEENLLPNWSGSGGKKYATIPIDENLRSYTFEQSLADFNGIVGNCIHEFIHTIEYCISCYDFHNSINTYIPTDINYKLYLLNQLPADFAKLNENEYRNKECFTQAWRNSEKVGVPYCWWTNEIFDVIIKPECVNGRPDGYGGVGTVDYGGSIHYYNPEELDWWRSKDSSLGFGQRIPKGSRTTALYVSPKKGYKFIGWSDGVTDELRVVTDVQENITLIAYFERQSYTIEYKATEGGRIDGEAVQTLLVGERTECVTAIADEGYRFVGWSDNNEGYFNSQSKNIRSDVVGTNVHDENGELYHRLGFTVTAIFEKIEE